MQILKGVELKKNQNNNHLPERVLDGSVRTVKTV